MMPLGSFVMHSCKMAMDRRKRVGHTTIRGDYGSKVVASPGGNETTRRF